MSTAPELSVIIPVLNEAAVLPPLFACLAAQTEVTLELVFSDGGSTDSTVALIGQLAAECDFPVTLVTGPSGRGRQMNNGAGNSRGETLLFLHADSSFTDNRALRKGLDTIGATRNETGSERVAGRFALKFIRRDTAPSFGFFFYEWKATLDRRECIHGDQGLLLRRAFFNEVGPFAETVPVGEDTRLADEIRRRGRWLLLPAEIGTSGRRFETEGLRERQSLNAIIMNLAALEKESFLRELPGIYRSQDLSRKLELSPILSVIGRLIHGLPLKERLLFWYATGAYVRDNAWQLAFALDAWRAFGQRRTTAPCSTSFLAFYDRRLDRLTDNPPGRATAALLTWLWYWLIRLRVF